MLGGAQRGERGLVEPPALVGDDERARGPDEELGRQLALERGELAADPRHRAARQPRGASSRTAQAQANSRVVLREASGESTSVWHDSRGAPAV